MENVLKKIIDKKREKIDIYKNKVSENQLLKNIKNTKNFINFKDEIKKRTSEKKNFYYSRNKKS